VRPSSHHWSSNDLGENNLHAGIDLTVSEERVNVDRRRWRTSVVRVRILTAGLVLLAAGCAVLGLGSRLHRNAAPIGASPATIAEFASGSTPFAGAGPTGEISQATSEKAKSILAGLPLIFEPNQGQGKLDPSDARARFVARGAGYSLFLGSDGAILNLVSGQKGSRHGGSVRGHSLQMKLAGGNRDAVLSGNELLPGKSNYFIGNDPSKWRRGIPQFARVRYGNVYPGVDLVFYGNQGRLEYDFQVAPGADPSQAELQFDGADHVQLVDGALVLRTGDESVRLDAPSVYQEVDGRRQPVQGAFVLRGPNRAGFTVGSYDRSRELIIDPILDFSTYFGGSGDEHSTSVAVDGSFNIYLAGSTTSADLPAATGAFQGTLNGAQNVYIAKIQPPLGSLVAVLEDLTYLGGDGTDTPVGIKVDGEGNPFVAGTTNSANFPTTPTNAYQTTPKSAGTHVFVTKLKFDFGQLVYSSYLSGDGTDTASGMTIDASGDLYVTGTTTSVEVSTTDQFPATNLPQALPFQVLSRAPGLAQFFVTKVNTTAPKNASIAYSTYFGGGTFDTAEPIAVGGGIAVDTNLNIYFTGTTNFIYSGCTGCSATDFPILNAYQPCLDTAPPTTIVNPASCLTTTGLTASDAFVAKLDPKAAQGQQLLWSTYVGGTGTDSSTGVALDSGATNVYMIGTTDSSDIATSVNTLNTSAAYQRCLDTPVNPASGTACTPPAAPAPTDAFVARLTNPTSTTITLNYFSYLGGTLDDAGLAITVDSNSGAMMTGWTKSTDFPVFPASNPIQSALKGTQDAFLARINTAAVVGQTTIASWANYFGGTGIESGTGIALDVNQNTYLAGETNSGDLQVAKALQADNAGGYDSFVTQLGTAISLSIQGVLSLGTNQAFISAGNPATFTYTVTNNGPDLASNIVITANLGTEVTGVPLSNISASISSGTCGTGGSASTGVSCGPISLQSGSTATVTITATPAANSSGSSPVFFNGGTVQAIGPGNIVLAQTSVPAEMSDFSMSVSPSNQAVAVAGATATYQVQLTPHPLYASSITLSCSGLPNASTCAFTTTPVTLSSTSGASSTLNIVTTARPITATAIFPRQFYAMWLLVPGLALLGVGGGRRRKRIVGISLFMLISLLLLLPACSSSSQTQAPVSGTQPGNYTVTVTAASGSDSKSQSIGLSVP